MDSGKNIEVVGANPTVFVKGSLKLSEFLEVSQRGALSGFMEFGKKTDGGNYSQAGFLEYLLECERKFHATKQARRLMLQHALKPYKELVAVLGGLEQAEKDEHL